MAAAGRLGLVGRMRRVVLFVMLSPLVALGALVLCVTETPLAESLARPLVIYAPLARADAIVVLGGGVRPDGELGDATQRRLVYALRLLRQGYAPTIILTGGNPEDRAVPESEEMARVARELGFPAGSFIVETRASRTSTQARAVAEIARTRGFRSVIVVTSPTHSYRALRAFRKAGVDALPGTIDPLLRPIPRKPGWWHEWFALTTGKTIARVNLAALVSYEYGALAVYWYRGWI